MNIDHVPGHPVGGFHPALEIEPGGWGRLPGLGGLEVGPQAPDPFRLVPGRLRQGPGAPALDHLPDNPVALDLPRFLGHQDRVAQIEAPAASAHDRPKSSGLDPGAAEMLQDAVMRQALEDRRAVRAFPAQHRQHPLPLGPHGFVPKVGFAHTQLNSKFQNPNSKE